MKYLDDLRQVIRTHGLRAPDNSFAICYGSSVRTGSRTSDLDMLIVEREVSDPALRADFTERLVALHRAEGRAIDQEVPYANKLFYTLAELSAGLGQDMFWQGEDENRFSITTFVGAEDDDPYFASPAMKLRLALNALTSAHVFLEGGRPLYERARQGAVISLGYLAAQIIGEDVLTLDTETAASYLERSGDAVYKDFLGYERTDDVFIRSLAVALLHVRLRYRHGCPLFGREGHAFLRSQMHDLLVRPLDEA